MALKQRSDGGPTGDALAFWSDLSQRFGGNDLVLFELYNEPHTDTDTWMQGSQQYAGMLEMIDTVRQHAPNVPLVIAGAADYGSTRHYCLSPCFSLLSPLLVRLFAAYGGASLIQLHAELVKRGEERVIWNFHP